MSRRPSSSSRVLLAPLATVSLIAAAGYWAYSRYYGSSPSRNNERILTNNNTTSRISSVSKSQKMRIALVVSKSLLEAGIPLETLLTRYPNLVVVVAPDVTQTAELQLIAQIPGDVKYKVISCETDMGVIHVLKHLRSDLVVLPADRDVNKDIGKFVGKVEVLSEQIEQANSELYDLFFRK